MFDNLKHYCTYRKLIILVLLLVVSILGWLFRSPSLGTDLKIANQLDGISLEDTGLAFASYYGDHMVLQQAPKMAQIWGYANMSDVGKSIMLEVTDTLKSYHKMYSNKVMKGPFADKAIWSVQLDPSSSKGPYVITVTLETEMISIKDVLFGDVWVCSGQSNMAFTLDMMLNASEELAHVQDFPEIRVFTVDLVQSSVPLYDLKSVSQNWSLPSNFSLGQHQWKYFSAVCWLYGRHLYQTLGYPIGLIDTNWGGTPVESWMSKEALAKCGLRDNQVSAPEHLVTKRSDLPFKIFVPEVGTGFSVLYNAMIHPLLNITIYGAIWYQGEANAGSPNTYNCTFPTMIDDWRDKFTMGSLGQTGLFPFGFVQLAPNQNAPDVTTGFPDIRWHQTADFGYVPNNRMKSVFMAVAMDLPDFQSPFGSVHPRDKMTVVDRLALSGLAVAYGKQYKYQGPLPSAYTIDIGFYTLVIEFDDDRTAIQVRNDTGFEVCCSSENQTYCPNPGSKWVSVPINKAMTNAVQLDWKACAKMYIVGVRYAWRESPCSYKKCAIYAVEESLPMAPFFMQGLIGDGKRHAYKYYPTI